MWQAACNSGCHNGGTEHSPGTPALLLSEQDMMLGWEHPKLCRLVGSIDWFLSQSRPALRTE